jgi:hypothetical protein
MSTETRKSVEELIAELHYSAARNIALAEQSRIETPWRRHDVRIYRERAEADLLAVQHLEKELA